MAYRDPVEAARVRVAAAQEHTAARLERMRPELTARLPRKLSRQLERAKAEVTREADDLEALQQLAKALSRYARLIDKALRLAPELEETYNRLSHRFPDRQPVEGYNFFDVYHQDYREQRPKLHQRIRAIDADARLLDLRKGYFDFEERPFLVEALLRRQKHPLRLQIYPTGLNTDSNQQMGVYPKFTFLLVTHVRPSTPKLRLSPETWSRSLLAALRLRRDVTVGHEPFDGTFLVDVEPEEIERTLSPELCEALLSLAEVDVPTLQVARGLAQLQWEEPIGPGEGLEAAAQVLCALRVIDPVPLLVPRSRR